MFLHTYKDGDEIIYKSIITKPHNAKSYINPDAPASEAIKEEKTCLDFGGKEGSCTQSAFGVCKHQYSIWQDQRLL